MSTVPSFSIFNVQPNWSVQIRDCIAHHHSSYRALLENVKRKPSYRLSLVLLCCLALPCRAAVSRTDSCLYFAYSMLYNAAETSIALHKSQGNNEHEIGLRCFVETMRIQFAGHLPIISVTDLRMFRRRMRRGGVLFTWVSTILYSEAVYNHLHWLHAYCELRSIPDVCALSLLFEKKGGLIE